MKVRFFVLVLFIIAASTFAQTRIMVMQDVVYPYKTEQYEKAQKDMNEWLTKNNMGIKWVCLQRENYTYSYVVEISNYAKMDEISKLWQEKMKTVDKKDFETHANAFNGTIAHTNEYIMSKVDKGSYVSPNPYSKKEENTFIHWDYFEIIPGMESEAQKLLEQEAALSEKTKQGLSYNLWRTDVGENTSSFLFASWGKDRVNFFTDVEKDNKLGGKEMEDIDKKFMTMVQKFDHWNGKLRQDLSIQPIALSEEKK